MQLECFIFGVITFLITGGQCEEIEVFAKAGSQAVLPCKCSVSSPLITPGIIWSNAAKGTVWRKQKSGLQFWGASWLQNGIQRAQCPHFKFEKGDYSLQINNVREEDAGIYTCRVEHEVRVTETVVTLRVIRVSVSPPVVLWGNDVSIRCDVTPPPNGATVRWMLNDSPFVPQSAVNSTSMSSQSVISERARVKLSGIWTCIFSYKGKKEQVSANLIVKGIIKPSKDNAKVYAAVGSAVTLPCVYSTGLNPSKPVWEKLKPEYIFKPVPDRLPASFSASLPSSQVPWDKSASLKEVGFEDSGKYRCSGTIEGQRLSQNMQLVTAKINSTVPSKKRGSVTLTCQLSDTSEVLDYDWVHVVYDYNGTKSIGSVQKGKTLTISKESEGNSGEWTCRFYGKEGILGNVTHHIHHMGALSGQKSSGVSRNTAAIVGLSFLLIVLLLVLAQMCKNHQRRKRIFQYPALETIVHTISNEREERERNRVKK